MKQRLFLLVTMMIILPVPAVSQSTVADGPWSGQIQCQLNIEQQGYSRHETQTWTLTSSTPTGKSGDIRIYPAIWAVSGQGAVQRTLSTRSSLAQWNINVPPANTSIAMFVRAQDKQFIIRLWQRSAPSYTGMNAMRQMAENGIPQQPVKISSAVYEWTLPWIQAEPREITRGKFSVATESLGADLTPLGAAPTAECTYHFSRTASGSTVTASSGGQDTKGSASDASAAAGGGAKGAAADSQSGAVNNSGAAASAKYGPDSQGAAAGAKGAGDSQSTADTSGSAASAKYGTNSQGGAAAAGAGASGTSGAVGKDASVTTNQKGSAAGSQAGGPSAGAGIAGPGSQSSGTSNTPIPNDTTGSGSSGSQTCTISDIASMYDKTSQNIELMFAKLTKEAQTAKNTLSDELPKESLSASVASGDAQAMERIKYLDQAIAQIPSVEQGSVQELAKAKQKAIEQITKAQTDAERNEICQATRNTVTQMLATVESEAKALDAGISGAGPSGSTPAIDVANLRNSLPAKQPPATSTAPVTSLMPVAPLVTITAITPNAAAQGDKNLSVTLNGKSTHFVQGTTTADFGPGITLASPLTVTSPTSATATLNIDPTAAIGPRTVTVKTGTENASLAQGFNVSPTFTATPLAPGIISIPAVTQVSPNSHPKEQTTFTVTITGNSATHFSQASKVDLGSAIVVSNVTASSPRSLQATLNGVNAQPGPYTVKVTTGTEVAKLVDGFTVTPPITTGNYRISINGFRVNSETNAGAFGEHNAVYAAAAVEVVDRRNNLNFLQTPVMVRSKVHGDTRKDPNRVRAGSFPPSGGFLVGDTMPAGQDPASTTLTPNTFSFPLLLWQGPLTDGIEAVVVRPTLWVWNGRSDAFDTWAGEVTGHVNGFFMDHWEEVSIKNNIQLSESTLVQKDGMSLLNCNGEAVLAYMGAPPPCTPGSDRPIGLRVCGSGYTNEVMWCDLAVVVTREIIEKALASPYQAGGIAKGVVQIHLADFVDSTNSWAGNYDLYLRAEKVP